MKKPWINREKWLCGNPPYPTVRPKLSISHRLLRHAGPFLCKAFYSLSSLFVPQPLAIQFAHSAVPRLGP